MIVGLYQAESPKGNVAKAIETLAQVLESAASANVDMLVFPEVFVPGYGAATSMPPDGWGDVEAQLAALCKSHTIGMTIGLPEYSDGKVFNSALAFGADGQELARYRKIQLFGEMENALYTPGDSYTTFTYMGRTFGLLICYDVEFPEHVRALKRMGAEIVLVPTANMMPFINVNQFLVPARAAENDVTVVYANYCGSEGDLDYVGLSTICGPDGHQLAGKGTGPGLCIAEIPNGWSEHGIPASTQISDLRDIS